MTTENRIITFDNEEISPELRKDLVEKQKILAINEIKDGKEYLLISFDDKLDMNIVSNLGGASLVKLVYGGLHSVWTTMVQSLKRGKENHGL